MSGILVMRLRGLGDIIHLLPSLRLLREQNPSAKLGFFCQHPFGQIIPPELDIKVIEMPAGANFAQLLRLARQIKKYRFTALFDLFSNPATAIVAALSGIKQRYGFGYRVRRWAYHETWLPPNPNHYLSQLFADFFDHFGISGRLPSLALNPSPQLLDKSLKALPPRILAAPFRLAINPHSTYQAKAWPQVYYLEFIKLWYKTTGLPVLITWGPGEREAAEKLAKMAGHERAILHAALRIDEFAAMLKQVNLLLTCDTGPMHLAWAVGTPVTALFGPTTREPVYPRGEQHLVLCNKQLDCLQCHREYCAHHSCMRSLTPQVVFDAILAKYSINILR